MTLDWNIMFYCFNQNNSGGSFDFDENAGITHYVIIEADDAEHADARAENIGLYFDGAGDCPCCGDRWYPAYGAGDDEPSIFGESVSKFIHNKGIKWMPKDQEACVHYADGRMEWC